MGVESQSRLTNVYVRFMRAPAVAFALSSHKKSVFVREETDYRFEIIVYMHRKFQMFEFPPLINVNKREKCVPSFFQIQIVNKIWLFLTNFVQDFGLVTLLSL